MKLGELLVKQGAISQTQLQQALHAQKVYGGKLGTNLVELGLLTETQLTLVLAKKLNMPSAQPSDFEGISDDIIKLVSADFAEQHQIIPINTFNQKLRVAFSDPLDLNAREEVAFRVGRPITPLVAPEILIHFALEKYYGIPAKKRFLKISEEPEEEERLSQLIIRDRMEQVRSVEKAQYDEESQLSVEHPGAYTLKALCYDLFKATSKEEVFQTVFRFLTPSFTQMAVFIQRQDEVWGWMQQGFTIDTEKLRQRLCTLSDESAISKVFNSKDVELKPHWHEIDRKIIQSLGGHGGTAFYLFPMLAQGRAVAVFLASSGKAAATRSLPIELDIIQQALTKGAIALQMVSYRRKLLTDIE